MVNLSTPSIPSIPEGYVVLVFAAWLVPVSYPIVLKLQCQAANAEETETPRSSCSANDENCPRKHRVGNVNCSLPVRAGVGLPQYHFGAGQEVLSGFHPPPMGAVTGEL